MPSVYNGRSACNYLTATAFVYLPPNRVSREMTNATERCAQSPGPRLAAVASVTIRPSEGPTVHATSSLYRSFRRSRLISKKQPLCVDRTISSSRLRTFSCRSCPIWLVQGAELALRRAGPRWRAGGGSAGRSGAMTDCGRAGN